MIVGRKTAIRLGIAIVVVLCVAVLILSAASMLFLKLQSVANVPAMLAWWCWIPYWLQYGQQPSVRAHLLIAMAVPGGLVVFLLGTLGFAFLSGGRRLRPARRGQKPPPPTRAASDVHGFADWMSIKDARKLFPGPTSAYGGVVIGEAYRVDETSVAADRFDPGNARTWGQGGKAPLLIDPCTSDATHGAIFAGSGGYKTTAITLPTLACWTGSVVTLDPSCQVGPMVAAMRRGMNHKVAMVGPGLDGFNVLDWIEPANPMAEVHLQEVVEWIAGQSKQETSSSDKNEIFKVRGKELLTAILADLLWSDSPAQAKNLRTFRERVTTPEKMIRGLLADIHKKSKSKLARSLAGSLMDVYQETFSGIYSNANADTQWLSVEPYAAMLCGNSFNTKDLCGGTLSVFVQIPMESLRATPELGRVVIGSLMNAVYQVEGQLTGRVLFLLDEINFLGRMKVLENALHAGRKYGITMVGMWQSLGQMNETWGEHGRSSWLSSVSWSLFAAVSDQTTAEYVSKECGTYTVLTRTEGRSSGSNSGSGSGSRNSGRNEGMAEASRPLIRPEEVRTRMRADEQIVFRRSAPPLRCGRAIYFRRPDLLAKVQTDSFGKAAE